MVAVVVTSGSEVSLQDIEMALGSRLARFKQPKQVVNVAELPRNTMGKVKRTSCANCMPVCLIGNTSNLTKKLLGQFSVYHAGLVSVMMSRSRVALL